MENECEGGYLKLRKREMGGRAEKEREISQVNFERFVNHLSSYIYFLVFVHFLRKKDNIFHQVSERVFNSLKSQNHY